MSYASRLLAMSRDRVLAIEPRVVGGEPDPPQEQIVETAVAAPPQGQDSRAETPGSRTRTTPAPVVPQVAADTAEVNFDERLPRTERTIERTVDRQTVVVAAAPGVTPAPLPPARSLPPQAQWLLDDVRGSDPLVAGAETDVLRDLMRTVRQWTSTAPTVIEAEVEASPAPQGPASVVAPPPSNQISIGNVTNTVAAAPARAARAGAPARATSDRMARHLIRER
ncbi:MAG: hypothetical protein WKG01_35935 [Kofleriaceae bacterium]